MSCGDFSGDGIFRGIVLRGVLYRSTGRVGWQNRGELSPPSSPLTPDERLTSRRVATASCWCKMAGALFQSTCACMPLSWVEQCSPGASLYIPLRLTLPLIHRQHNGFSGACSRLRSTPWAPLTRVHKTNAVSIQLYHVPIPSSQRAVTRGQIRLPPYAQDDASLVVDPLTTSNSIVFFAQLKDAGWDTHSTPDLDSVLLFGIPSGSCC